MFFQIIMKILPKLSYDYFIQQNSKSKLCQSNTTAQKTTAADLNNIPHYIHTISRVSFLGNISEQTNAQNYLNTQKANLNSKNIKNIDISCFDLEKLEGIQSGIKIFDGLNMKEIAFITTNLLEIAVNRGCYNNCAHCYAEGLPPLKETEKQTSKMGWENFKSLCNGFKELNNRLGFNIFNPDSYMTAFHDADCSQIYLEDKDGNIHDWTEIAKNLYSATGHSQLFDTAGWYLEDKKAQARVEKYVKDALKDKDKSYFLEFNISANPYHAMHYRAVQHMKKGNKEKEYFFREKDAQRMANVLFTLTPLLNLDNKLNFIARAMNPMSKNSEGLNSKDLVKTYNLYFDNLKKLYIDDYYGEQKIIKNKKDIQRYINAFQAKLSHIDTQPGVTKRLAQIYAPDDPSVIDAQNYILNSPAKALEQHFYTIIDANGDIYMTNFYESYKTDLKLNFENSHKSTRLFAPNLCSEPVTKKMINKHTKQLYNS